MIREGFEDYEYLKLVADLGDPVFAEQTGRQLFPSTYEARQPAASLYAAREALAQRILALKGGTSPAPVRVEETASDIVRGPNQWTWGSGTNANASAGGYLASATAGATCASRSPARASRGLALADSCSGQATVDVDGTTQTIDAYVASGGGWQYTNYCDQRVCLIGSHTITITALGTKQAASCAAWIYFDAFEVIH